VDREKHNILFAFYGVYFITKTISKNFTFETMKNFTKSLKFLTSYFGGKFWRTVKRFWSDKTDETFKN